MARPVTITLSHELGKEEARRRIEEGFVKIKSAMAGGMLMKFEESWQAEDKLAFTARGMGQTITGEIDVFPEHVRIVATLPGLLASLAETITGQVEKQGRILLEKK